MEPYSKFTHTHTHKHTYIYIYIYIYIYLHGVDGENFNLIYFAMKKNRWICNSVYGLSSDVTSSSGYTVSVMVRLRIVCILSIAHVQ